MAGLAIVARETPHETDSAPYLRAGNFNHTDQIQLVFCRTGVEYLENQLVDKQSFCACLLQRDVCLARTWKKPAGVRDLSVLWGHFRK